MSDLIALRVCARFVIDIKNSWPFQSRAQTNHITLNSFPFVCFLSVSHTRFFSSLSLCVLFGFGLMSRCFAFLFVYSVGCRWHGPNVAIGIGVRFDPIKLEYRIYEYIFKIAHRQKSQTAHKISSITGPSAEVILSFEMRKKQGEMERERMKENIMLSANKSNQAFSVRPKNITE